jgi:quercetin dioxygenase-like cupin family protein
VALRGFVLREGEGRRYNWFGYDFIVKAGQPETGGAVGFMEFVTERGREPTDHVHEDEDEIFVLLQGSMTVRCGEDQLEVQAGDFVFLPRNVRHGFTIHSERVRMFVITAPDEFSRRVEAEGQAITESGSR